MMAFSSGKLRRYFDIKRISPTRSASLRATREALSLMMKRYKPDVVFSKEALWQYWLYSPPSTIKFPTIIHESDMTPGLANKILYTSAAKVCCNFPRDLKIPSGRKGRAHWLLPSARNSAPGRPLGLSGLSYTHLSPPPTKPVILVMAEKAGSLSNAVRKILPRLLPDFQMIHICGKGQSGRKSD